MRFLLFFTFFFFRQCRSIFSVLKMRCERLRPFWPLINRKPLKKYSLISSSQSVTVTGARFDKNYRGTVRWYRALSMVQRGNFAILFRKRVASKVQVKISKKIRYNGKNGLYHRTVPPVVIYYIENPENLKMKKNQKSPISIAFKLVWSIFVRYELS